MLVSICQSVSQSAFIVFTAVCFLFLSFALANFVQRTFTFRLLNRICFFCFSQWRVTFGDFCLCVRNFRFNDNELGSYSALFDFWLCCIRNLDFIKNRTAVRKWTEKSQKPHKKKSQKKKSSRLLMLFTKFFKLQAVNHALPINQNAI